MIKRYQLESYEFEDGASHRLFVSDTGKYVLYSDRYALALEVLIKYGDAHAYDDDTLVAVRAWLQSRISEGEKCENCGAEMRQINVCSNDNCPHSA